VITVIRIDSLTHVKSNCATSAKLSIWKSRSNLQISRAHSFDGVFNCSDANHDGCDIQPS